jgi:hypothetical protein
LDFVLATSIEENNSAKTTGVVQEGVTLEVAGVAGTGWVLMGTGVDGEEGEEVGDLEGEGLEEAGTLMAPAAYGGRHMIGGGATLTTLITFTLPKMTVGEPV